MRATLFILAFLTALVVGALFAAPLLVDGEDFRDDVQAELSRTLGREVRLEGEVGFRILPSPRLNAGGLVVNGGAGDTEPLLTARRLAVRLSLSDLLSGDLVAERVDLVDPVFTLHTDLSGHANFTGLASAGQAGAPTIGVVGVSGGVLNYRDEELGRAASAAGISGEVSIDDGTQTVSGHFAGVWRARDVDLNFRLGRGDRRTVFAEATTDDLAMLRMQGRYADGPEGPLTGRLDADIADLRAFEVPAALVPPGDAPLPLQLRADARLDGPNLNLSGIVGSLAGAAFGGRLGIDFGAAPSVDAGLAFEKLPGPPVLAALRHWPDGEAGVAAALERVPELQARLRLDIGLMEFPGGYVRQFALDARFADGGISIGRMSALLPGGSDVAYSGELRLAAGAYRLDGSVEVVSDNLVSLMTWGGMTIPQGAEGRLRNLSLSARLSMTSEVAQITDIDLRLDQSRLTGGVAVALVRRPSFSVNLALDQINADAYAGLFGLPAWRWDTVAPDADQPALPWLGAFDTNATVRVDRMVVGGSVVDDVFLDASLLGGALDLKRLRIGSVEGAAVELSGSVQDPADPRFTLTASVDAPDLGGFLSGLGIRRAGIAGRMQETTLDAAVDGGFRDMSMTVDFSSAAVSGVVKGAVTDWLAGPTADLDVHLESPASDGLRQLVFPDWRLPFTLAGPATVDGHVSGAADALKIDGRIDSMGARLDLAGEVGAGDEGGTAYRLDARIRHGDVLGLMESLWDGYRPVPGAGGALDAHAAVEGTAQGLSLSGLQLSAGGDRLSGDVSVDWSQRVPAFTVDVSEGNLDLGRYLSAGHGGGDAGRRWSLAPIETDWLKRLQLDGQFALGSVAVGDLDAADVSGDFAIADGRLTLENIHAGIGGGEIEGRFSLGSGASPSVGVAVSGHGVPLSDVVGPLLRTPPGVTGRTGFDVQLTGQGVTMFDVVRSLSGSIAVSDGELAFEPRPDENLPAVRMGALSGGFDVADGVLRISQPIASAEGPGRIVGSIDLPRWVLDLELQDAAGAAAEGGAPASLFVTGSLDDPRAGVLQ